MLVLTLFCVQPFIRLELKDGLKVDIVKMVIIVTTNTIVLMAIVAIITNLNNKSDLKDCFSIHNRLKGMHSLYSKDHNNTERFFEVSIKLYALKHSF